jgi:hypothetical protein
MGSTAPSSFTVQRLDGGSVVTLTLLRAQCLDVAGKQTSPLRFDGRVLSLLVRSNWIRVAAWSAAGAIALWMSRRVFMP